MADIVNLDALIPREDFLATEVSGAAGQKGKGEASRTDFMPGEIFYSTLRKPDFQRETAAWTPEAVHDFIKAFVEGDLIPAVICWQSHARLSFVIDGAHRLSALIAWLRDDYGDGEVSRNFYENKITEEQRRIADKTRILIKKGIGPWADYAAEARNPGTNQKLTLGVRSLANSKIPLLWVQGEDATKAEQAFLTINRQAVQIDPTELKILSARFKPNAIVSRAIVRNAGGTKYWSKLSISAQREIESVASGIFSALYSPPLKSPLRTPDLPIAGYSYGSQTLPLIFDLVNIANRLPVVDSSRIKKAKPATPETPDEDQVLDVLRKTNGLVSRMTGVAPASLGLHPVIYFYSANGRHQPTSVLAVAELVSSLIANDMLDDFCRVRKEFENFLLKYKDFLNQLTIKHGSMAKGYLPIKEFLLHVLRELIAYKTVDVVRAELKDHERYFSLVDERPVKSKRAKEFSQKAKQWIYLSETLPTLKNCHICGARLDDKAMTLDHKIDKSAGGLATDENAGWVHPYCNSAFKYSKAFEILKLMS